MLNLQKASEKNPRILDLRKKLDEITKKQERSVDKQTKGLINTYTQQLEDKNELSDSGPYSLLFELQPEPSTSKEEDVMSQKVMETDGSRRSIPEDVNITTCNKSGDKLLNVIELDKPMKEYEYSCENELSTPLKRTFNVHSRSELCLHFKPSTQISIENTSPSEHSVSRANEENSLDDSLGILTPDQMDDVCYFENTFSPTVEGLPLFCDNETKNSPGNSDTPSTDKTDNSAASTMFLQNNMLAFNDKVNVPEFNCIISTEESNPPSGSNKKYEGDTRENRLKLDLNNESRNTSEIMYQKSGTKDCHSTVKEELITNFLEDELFPSISSSILEPISSIGDTTVNLDLSLDCKNNENRLVIQRIEQTPSPEELPLDSSDIHGEVSTYSNSQFSTSTLHDSNTYSDIKNEFTKSIETSKVSNSFITSITSITSLDGYQGDGELSRPVSRSADHSIGQREEIIEMDWQNVPVARRPDPMTDSDFFTESDADGLDDHIQRGDRRAQVIDGALYGGKNNNGNPPLIVNRSEDSCMDSSGVYTDFENHRSSPVFLNAIEDMSPGGSSLSTQSECSQKNSNGAPTNEFAPIPEDVLKKDYISKNSSSKNNSKRNSLNMEKDDHSKDKISKDEKKSFTLKKYKMPKRDVPSKVKTILNTRKAESDVSNQNSPKMVKRNERRDIILKKTASNDSKNDYKTKSFKDIKSKVDCSFSLQRSQTACSVSRMLSSKSTSTNSKPKRLVYFLLVFYLLLVFGLIILYH